MKWFGAITDDKDLTTKEYVDSGDSKLEAGLKELDESKVDAEDMVEFTAIDIQAMWTRHVK